MNELSTLDFTETSPRELVDIEELREARKLGWLIEDPDRRRPRYFDGRFLTGSDLIRDQKYFLSRQLDFGRMSGGGVINGLDVQVGDPPVVLLISPGHGVTPSGDSVMIRDTVTVDLTDVPTIQRLDATFGLEVRPNAPVRNISGLFVVALRNVEYTANPVATYPKDLQTQRRIEDGAIIEATAITLIPFQSVAPTDLGRAGQARLAREIFLRKISTEVPAEALAIAVISVQRGQIQWVDRYLVRRDASVDDSLGFGLPHRAVREAFLRQYVEHLAVIPQAVPFAASDRFQALPPFGPLPKGNLEIVGNQFLQSYFPAEFNVELTIIPEDELAALQEEAVALPPIDLRARATTAEATSVQMLIPVARTAYANFVSRLEGRLTRSPLPRSLRPRSRKDLGDILVELRGRILRLSADVPVDVNLQPWQDALAAVPFDSLFYTRRRRFSEVAFSFSRFQAFPPDSPNPSETLSNVVSARLIAAHEIPQPDADPLTQTERLRFDFMLRKTTNEVLLRIEELLGRALFDAPLFVNGVVAELAFRTRVRLDDLLISADARQSVIGTDAGVIAPEGSAPVRVRALRLHDVEQVVSRYTRSNLGQGFAVFTASDLTDDVRAVLAESFRIPELDQALRDLAAPADKQAFAAAILENAQNGDIGALRDMVDLQFAPPDVDEFLPIPSFDGSKAAIEVGEGRLYHLIHAFADPGIQRRLSNLFDPNAIVARPNFNQHVIISTVLAECLVLGWTLDLVGGDDFARVNELFTKVLNWDPTDPLGFPVEDLAGNANVTVNNSLLTEMFDAYETLESDALAGDLATLTNVLRVNGLPLEQNRFRMFGLTQSSVSLIVRLIDNPRTDETAADVVAKLITFTNSGIVRDARSPSFLESLTTIASGGKLPA